MFEADNTGTCIHLFVHFKMSAPMGHDRSRPPPKEDDEEEDPVDKMLDKSGCKELHFAVQVSLSSVYIITLSDCIFNVASDFCVWFKQIPKREHRPLSPLYLFRVDFY